MRLLPIIVTYYPTRGLLLDNFRAFSGFVDKVLIWENTPSEEALMYRFIEDSRAEYVSNGCNSISKALNYAWHYAEKEGYDALLTMDQDSLFLDFEGYYLWAEKTINMRTAICSPWIYAKLDNEMVVSQEQAITSGMIVPMQILNAVGGYYEDFDVEAIDIDFCLRAKQKGFDILQNSNYILQQRFGNTYRVVRFGHEFSGPGYSASRLRYIFRNFIIAYRRNGKPSSVLKQVHWFVANYVPNILFCEKDKIRKLFSILIGYAEGWLTKVSSLT